MAHKAVLKIWDLDCSTTGAEVEEALKKALPKYEGDMGVNLSCINTREQRLAIVYIEEEAANILLNTGRLRVGLVNCRIEREKVIPRCYKCLGYEHESLDCKTRTAAGFVTSAGLKSTRLLRAKPHPRTSYVRRDGQSLTAAMSLELQRVQSGRRH